MSKVDNSERPTTRLRASRGDLRVVVALPECAGPSRASEPTPIFEDVEIDVAELTSGEPSPSASH